MVGRKIGNTKGMKQEINRNEARNNQGINRK
jgi:hypothetical protein